MSRSLDARGLIAVRVSYELTADSGDCEIRPALRYSNDGVAWDTPKEIVATYQNGTGPTWGTTYIDITALGTSPRAYVQFGVEARNGTAGAIQLCAATIRIEPREKL